MSTLSLAGLPDATQSPTASPDDEKLRAWFDEWRTGRLRALLSQHLRYGDEARIARILGIRPESISRQLSHSPTNRERLSDDLATLGQHFVTMNLGAAHKVVNEIRELRHLGLAVSRIRLVLDLSQQTGTCEWTYAR